MSRVSRIDPAEPRGTRTYCAARARRRSRANICPGHRVHMVHLRFAITLLDTSSRKITILVCICARIVIMINRTRAAAPGAGYRAKTTRPRKSFRVCETHVRAERFGSENRFFWRSADLHINIRGGGRNNTNTRRTRNIYL